MRRSLITGIATLLVFLSVPISMIADGDNWISKVVADESFDVAQSATLKVEHEFGSVSCTNWDKNVIAVKAIVKVKSTNAEKAQKIIDKVKVDVQGSESEVMVSCDLNQRGNKMQIEIKLSIMMPASVNLKLDHQFGNAYIEKVEGYSDIKSEYGSMEIVELAGENNSIDLSYGNLSLTKATNADVDVSYGRCSINDIGNGNIESSYSSLIIDNAGHLSLENSGGDVEIGTVETIDMESDFSAVIINNVVESVTAETDYGNLTINNVSKGFSLIDIENEYCTVTVRIPEDINYMFDLTGEFSDINFPDKSEISYRKKGVDETVIKGVIGGGNPTSSVRISAEYGGIKLKN